MVVGAALNGSQLEVVDAVTPDEIDTKTIGTSSIDQPSTLLDARISMSCDGGIVSERIESAIIIEDDADWDMSLKTQL
ncbi:hypothetical protein BDW69DRAFT_189491 [Aspergillus filifer]